MNVLVTGGAGYIGSHAVKHLCQAGFDVVVLDNLSLGHRAAVDERAELVVADLLQTDRVASVLADNRVDVVMHFAALSLVGESVAEPARYLRNNVEGTRSLLTAMATSGTQQMVFSSSCSVYGEPGRVPIDEGFPRAPVSPYGATKAACEDMLRQHASENPGFSAFALRYFNVAGCDADGVLGEDHNPETHLVPLVLQAAAGERDGITIFGTDYPTADGTCIRDYVHVDDLARAHILAMRLRKPGMTVCNLGIGQGFSVKEVIQSARRVTGVDFPVTVGERRPGDPPELWADASQAASLLGWVPEFTDLDAIVRTAWRWKQDVGRYPPNA